MTPRKPGFGWFASPYVAFKDDSERRRALMSRDRRLVLIALIAGLTNVPAETWVWLRSFVG
jgi:hypothetical protein